MRISRQDWATTIMGEWRKTSFIVPSLLLNNQKVPLKLKEREGVTLYSGPEDEKPVTRQDLTLWCKVRWQYDNPFWSRSG